MARKNIQTNIFKYVLWNKSENLNKRSRLWQGECHGSREKGKENWREIVFGFQLVFGSNELNKWLNDFLYH